MEIYSFGYMVNQSKGSKLSISRRALQYYDGLRPEYKISEEMLSNMQNGYPSRRVTITLDTIAHFFEPQYVQERVSDFFGFGESEREIQQDRQIDSKEITMYDVNSNLITGFNSPSETHLQEGVYMTATDYANYLNLDFDVFLQLAKQYKIEDRALGNGMIVSQHYLANTENIELLTKHLG